MGDDVRAGKGVFPLDSEAGNILDLAIGERCCAVWGRTDCDYRLLNTNP